MMFHKFQMKKSYLLNKVKKRVSLVWLISNLFRSWNYRYKCI